MIIRKIYAVIKSKSWEFEYTGLDYTNYTSLLDNDINAFDHNLVLNCIYKNIIGAKIYDNIEAIMADIGTTLYAAVYTTFTDTGKISDLDNYPFEELKSKSRKQVFDEFCTSIEFEWNSDNQNISRHEIYGLIDDYHNRIRYEMIDYKPYNLRYKFGDIVEFNNPINGCNQGIVILASNELKSEAFCKSYDIAIRTGIDYELLWDSDEVVHEVDIKQCIGQDIDTAKQILQANSFVYYEGYIESMLN